MFENAIMPFLGVIIGSVISFAAQCYFYKKDKKEKHEAELNFQKNIASAFYGEISALLEIIKFRKYDDLAKSIVNHVSKHGFYAPFDHFISIHTDNFFYIYKKYVSEIKVLPHDLAKDIIIFYTNIFALSEDAMYLPEMLKKQIKESCGDDTKSLIQYFGLSIQEALKTDLCLLEKTINKGAVICNYIENKYL